MLNTYVLSANADLGFFPPLYLKKCPGKDKSLNTGSSFYQIKEKAKLWNNLELNI